MYNDTANMSTPHNTTLLDTTQSPHSIPGLDGKQLPNIVMIPTSEGSGRAAGGLPGTSGQT